MQAAQSVSQRFRTVGVYVCALGYIGHERIRLLSLKFGFFVTSWEYRKLSFRSWSHHVRVRNGACLVMGDSYRLSRSMAGDTQVHDIGIRVQ